VESTKQSATERKAGDRPAAGDHPIAAAAAVVVGGAAVVIALLVAAGLVITHPLAHPVGGWDDRLNRWFARHRTTTDNTITGDFTLLANTMGVVTVAAVAAIFAALRHRLRLAIALVIALGVELSCFLLVNMIVARPRPNVAHVGSTPSTYSFPSGHVAATFVLYGGIAVMVTMVTRRPLLRILAWTLPAILVPCVALSRIYRGDHHPTDTFAGLVLGVAAVAIAFAAVGAWSERSAGDHHGRDHHSTDAVDSRPPPVPAPVPFPADGSEHADSPVAAGQGRSA
jgi:membrane-associated phospholipid phosphatase